MPILPLLFVAVQEGMTQAMDSRRLGFEPFTWAAFVAALLFSGLVSKRPGNIGPLPIGPAMAKLLEPTPLLADTYGRTHGRRGLQQAIEESERLRSIGVFFREGLPRSFEEAKTSDAKAFARFHRGMIERGVFLAPSAFEAGFVSTVHGDAEVSLTLQAAAEAAEVAARG